MVRITFDKGGDEEYEAGTFNQGVVLEGSYLKDVASDRIIAMMLSSGTWLQESVEYDRVFIQSEKTVGVLMNELDNVARALGLKPGEYAAGELAHQVKALVARISEDD